MHILKNEFYGSNNTNKYNPQEQQRPINFNASVQIIRINTILKNSEVAGKYVIHSSYNTNKYNPQELFLQQRKYGLRFK